MRTISVLAWILLLAVATMAGTEAGTYPKPDEFVPVDSRPEMIHQQSPVYPTKARQAGLEGSVYIRSLIDRDGSVVESDIYKSSGVQSLDDAALAASHKCRFKPAMKDGRPVAVWITYRVEFALDDECGDDVAVEQDLPGPDQFVPVDVMPEMIYQHEPDYPPTEMQAGREGAVWVKALVGVDGDPLKVMVSKSSGSKALDKAALEAAWKNRFKPAVRDAESVPVWITYKTEFALE